MNNATRAVTLFFFFLLATAIVTAVPPFQESTANADELTILYPHITTFKAGANITLHFHVMGVTGTLQDNTTLICTLHTFNLQGNHIVDQNLTYEADDWKINQIVTTEIGTHSFNVWCQNSSIGGFVSGSYLITTTGIDDGTSNQTGLFFLAIIPLIVGVFLLVFVANMREPDRTGKTGKQVIADDHTLLKIVLSLLSFVFVYASMEFSTIIVARYFIIPTLIDALGGFAFWFTIVWAVIVAYWVIYFIRFIFNTAAQKEQERLEY